MYDGQQIEIYRTDEVDDLIWGLETGDIWLELWTDFFIVGGEGVTWPEGDLVNASAGLGEWAVSEWGDVDVVVCILKIGVDRALVLSLSRSDGVRRIVMLTNEVMG